jgi:Tfp pilus assembly protein FimV
VVAAPEAPDRPTPSPSRPATPTTPYTVVQGDNFWEIAARQLAAMSGRDRASLTDAEIHPYWVRVCDANRARIRSGDVNLIDPGELVDLPPL